MTKAPEPRKGMPSPQLDEAEFRRRFLSSFQDPAFDPLKAELDKVAGAAWDGYSNHRKSPRTRNAGPGYADRPTTSRSTGSARRRRSTGRKPSMTTPISRPAS